MRLPSVRVVASVQCRNWLSLRTQCMFRQSRYCVMKSGKRFLCSATFVVLCVLTTGFTGSAAVAEPFQVNVAGLKANDTVPDRFLYNHAGCAGENISPEISWSGVPPTAKSLALVVWDQDAPVSGGFYHWVIANIPVNTRKLPEGAGDVRSHKAPSGSTQVYNDWGESGYGGPCPPGHSEHRYHFILYALRSQQLPITARSKVSEAAAAIKQSAIASAEQVLVYGR
jgi:Raf kinase inhibitor-like YbhB/YbcL family protein